MRRGCKEKQTYVLKKRICKGHTGKGEQGSCNCMSWSETCAAFMQIYIPSFLFVISLLHSQVNTGFLELKLGSLNGNLSIYIFLAGHWVLFPLFVLSIQHLVSFFPQWHFLFFLPYFATIHLPSCFSHYYPPHELKHQGIVGEEEGRGQVCCKVPHGLNMVICHEAESLRKD